MKKMIDVKLTVMNIFKSKSACVYTRLYANLLTLNISQISRKFSHGKENFSYKVKLTQYSVLGHFNPKGGGGGLKVPAGQEIACHFSQDHTVVTKILDFIHKHLNYKVLKSFFDYRISSYSIRGNYSFLNLETQRSQYIRLNSKKNTFRGNYMTKYGSQKMTLVPCS